LRYILPLLSIIPLLLFSFDAAAQGDASCWEEEASLAFQKGYDAQQAGRTGEALQHYKACLATEPDCQACNYEIGWSYWVLERWPEVVQHWERLLVLNPDHPDAQKWLPKAKTKAGNRQVETQPQRSPPPQRSSPPRTVSGPPGAITAEVIQVPNAYGVSGLPSCKEAKRALREPPKKPGGRTRAGSSRRPDPSAMRRVGESSISSLPGYDTGGLRPQRLEGSPEAFEKIRRVFEKGDAGERVRVSVYGASHTSSDRFTGRLRETLQKRWGDGGKGHVLPGPLYKWYGGRHVSTCWSDGWLSDWQGKANAHKDGLLGHAGMSVSSSHPEEFGWLQTPSRGKAARSVSIFDVYALGQPGGGGLEVWIDGGKKHLIQTNRATTELLRTRFEVPNGSHRITVSPVGDGEVRIFGVSMENAGGAVVDAMGVRGMEARTWLGWESTLFAQGLRSLDPSLVVLAYGTNEAADQRYTMSEYRRDLRAVLTKLRSAAGDDVACVLAGPSDRGWSFDDGTYAIWDRTAPVAQVQREVAQEFDCGFWDWQEAMGGEGSMIGWKHLDPALGKKDLIHHTPAGYVFMADRFLSALEKIR